MAKPRRTQVEPPPPEPSRIPIAIAIAALIVFALLALGNSATTSATSDETAHLAAGFTALKLNDHRLNPEHPPLLKKLAALPLLGMNVWRSTDATQTHALMRESWAMAFAKGTAQWNFSHAWLYGVRDAALQRIGTSALNLPTTAKLERGDFVNDAHAMLFRARAMLLLTALPLGALIFVWSRELWGAWGGALSVLLFAFDPNFIAHSGLVTTDVGAALLMCATVWFFWRACTSGSRAAMAGFCAAFALAQVAKFSGVLLIPIIAVLAIHQRKQWKNIVNMLTIGAVVTVVTMWGAYGFRYTAAPDPARAMAEEAAARSTLMQASLDAPGRTPTGRFTVEGAVREWAATKALLPQYPQGPPFDAVDRAMPTTDIPLLGRIVLFANEHRLLPEAYLHGFAVVQLGAIVRSCYLNGEYSSTGFRSYFFWTSLYKLTIPALLLIVMGLAACLRRRTPALPFLAWPVAIYLGTAIVSAMNIGHRHILPIYPFVYIACGALALAWQRMPERRRVAYAVVTIVALAVLSNVVLTLPPQPVWNRHLAYMNELAGGPLDGHEELVDSNIDWGQDLPRLARWLEANGVTEPVNLLYFGTADPQHHGVRYVNVPLGYFAKPEAGFEGMNVPGYLAVSANAYRGITFAEDSRHFWREYLERSGARRVGTAGYSIFIYRIEQRPRL